MIKQAQIENLFSTPLYMNSLERKITLKEKNLINSFQDKTVLNLSNYHTKESYVLNNKGFKNLKKFIQECCDDYLEKVISPSDDVKLNITQSWINYSNQNQYHQEHCHTNSYISGVLYINAKEENDAIQFTNNAFRFLNPNIKHYNVWNSKTRTLNVRTGMLIMFPSHLYHSVKVNRNNYTRTSIAFNTFLKGTIGGGLGELKL
tara:strand:+ start:725 stop:1336 length:612 start_codon:yes stop_codon:yes gene_type:complete